MTLGISKLRNVIAHVKREHGTATIAPCPHCKRKFATGNDLVQHVSTSHPTQPAIRYACFFCPEHSFKTFDARDKHVRLNHPRRKLPPSMQREQFSCGHCPAVFKTGIRLARHVTAEHPPPPSPLAPGEATPLDAYFEAHRDKNDFCYDRRTVPSHSFNRLRKYLQWEGDELLRERRAFSTALREELVLWFGGEEIHALQRLSRALRVRGARYHVPYSVNAFLRNFQDKYVNLIDLLHWARHERDVSTGGEKGGGGVELEPVKTEFMP
ncbi:putative transcription factor c2h2 [Diplodia seriata]|uniref:Putative transcription factor c2h2 n=1 Tax=Diplodia seriata TaxID=420778 RepID=A0A0G2DZB0_9PEZI|nr:putative transcription factor c2h2 [Diplodia seriata]